MKNENKSLHPINLNYIIEEMHLNDSQDPWDFNLSSDNTLEDIKKKLNEKILDLIKNDFIKNSFSINLADNLKNKKLEEYYVDILEQNFYCEFDFKLNNNVTNEEAKGVKVYLKNIKILTIENQKKLDYILNSDMGLFFKKDMDLENILDDIKEKLKTFFLENELNTFSIEIDPTFEKPKTIELLNYIPLFYSWNNEIKNKKATFLVKIVQENNKFNLEDINDSLCYIIWCWIKIMWNQKENDLKSLTTVEDILTAKDTITYLRDIEITDRKIAKPFDNNNNSGTVFNINYNSDIKTLIYTPEEKFTYETKDSGSQATEIGGKIDLNLFSISNLNNLINHTSSSKETINIKETVNLGSHKINCEDKTNIKVENHFFKQVIKSKSIFNYKVNNKEIKWIYNNNLQKNDLKKIFKEVWNNKKILPDLQKCQWNYQNGEIIIKIQLNIFLTEYKYTALVS